MVKIEFSILARQCLNRRLADMESVRRETEAWAEAHNRVGATVEWHFLIPSIISVVKN